MAGSKYIRVGPTADSVPFDDSNADCSILVGSETSQEAFEALCIAVQNAISPGWTFGRSGQINKGAYLLNDTVPSNVSGRPIPIDGFIVKIAVSVQTAGNFSFTLEEHDGVTFTTLTTVSMVVADGRQKTFDISGVAVSKDKQLAVKVSSTSSSRPRNVDFAVDLNKFEVV